MYKIHTQDRALFESLIAWMLTTITGLNSALYFKTVEEDYRSEGLRIGLVWFLVCIICDVPLFLQGPMAMSSSDYVKDIGITYLIIPSITISTGFLLESVKGNKE